MTGLVTYITGSFLDNFEFKTEAEVLEGLFSPCLVFSGLLMFSRLSCSSVSGLLFNISSQLLSDVS